MLDAGHWMLDEIRNFKVLNFVSSFYGWYKNPPSNPNKLFAQLRFNYDLLAKFFLLRHYLNY
jgi:hypothetical protein